MSKAEKKVFTIISKIAAITKIKISFAISKKQKISYHDARLSQKGKSVLLDDRISSSFKNLECQSI